MMMTVAIIATILAISVPSVRNSVDLWRLGAATRDVERELQTARLKAVSTNRRLRVRLNCPVAGQVRVIELTGVTATDGAVNRCDPNVYPYPGPRDQDAATPMHDGPVRQLFSSITVTGSDLQFAPDGTVTKLVVGVPTAIVGSETITVTYSSRSNTINVNPLGRIAIQ